MIDFTNCPVCKRGLIANENCPTCVCSRCGGHALRKDWFGVCPECDAKIIDVVEAGKFEKAGEMLRQQRWQNDMEYWLCARCKGFGMVESAAGVPMPCVCNDGKVTNGMIAASQPQKEDDVEMEVHASNVIAQDGHGLFAQRTAKGWVKWSKLVERFDKEFGLGHQAASDEVSTLLRKGLLVKRDRDAEAAAQPGLVA